MTSYVYRQPGPPSTATPACAALWNSRGITVGFGYESQSNTVTMAQWRMAWRSYICEPSNDLAADNTDPGLMALLYPVDEVDNYVVQVRDSGKDPETVYAALEAWAANCKAKAPNKPTIVNLGLEQIRWNLPNGQPKVDYPRILKAVTYASVDYYPITRGLPITDYGLLVAKLQAMPGGNKVIAAFVECSHQHLNPTYYPKCRAPTATEFSSEIAMLRGLGLNIGLFPQQIGEDGTAFLYDAMPADLVAAFTAWAGKASAPPPAPAPAKTLSHTISVYSDGSVDVK